MKFLISIFLFFLYKFFILLFTFYVTKIFPLRIELPLICFYSIISSFQFLFFLYILFNLPRKNKTNASYTLTVYFPFLTILLEIIVLSVCGIYLLKMEQDFQRILFLILSTSTIHSIFYYFFYLNSISYLRNLPLTINKLKVMPKFLYFFLSFSLNTFYLYEKVFIERKFSTIDVIIVFTTFFTNVAILFLLGVTRIANSKRLSKSPLINFPLDFEIGYIQTQFKKAIENLRMKQKEIFDTDYISEDIKNLLAKYGTSVIETQYEVVILSFKYTLDGEIPGKTETIKDLIKTFGFYAKEYDAYPIFYGERVFLLFGFPRKFSHSYLNAMEVAERIIKDTSRLIGTMEDKSFFKIYSGICEGKINILYLPTKGSNLKEIVAIGDAIRLSEKILNIAESQMIPLLVTSQIYEKLKTRILVQKAFKVKDLEELLLYQVRL